MGIRVWIDPTSPPVDLTTPPATVTVSSEPTVVISTVKETATVTANPSEKVTTTVTATPSQSASPKPKATPRATITKWRTKTATPPSQIPAMPESDSTARLPGDWVEMPSTIPTSSAGGPAIYVQIPSTQPVADAGAPPEFWAIFTLVTVLSISGLILFIRRTGKKE